MKALSRSSEWPHIESKIRLVVKSSPFFTVNSAMPAKGQLHLCENTTSTRARLQINFACPFLGKIFLICDFIFFLSGFSFANIHESLDSRGKKGYFLAPLNHFHPLHRHINISWVITGESSPRHIASGLTQTRKPRFPSASRQPLSYTLTIHDSFSKWI